MSAPVNGRSDAAETLGMTTQDVPREALGSVQLPVGIVIRRRQSLRLRVSPMLKPFNVGVTHKFALVPEVMPNSRRHPNGAVLDRRCARRPHLRAGRDERMMPFTLRPRSLTDAGNFFASTARTRDALLRVRGCPLGGDNSTVLSPSIGARRNAQRQVVLAGLQFVGA
jgi:hypothetical protein